MWNKGGKGGTTLNQNMENDLIDLKVDNNKYFNIYNL